MFQPRKRLSGQIVWLIIKTVLGTIITVLVTATLLPFANDITAKTSAWKESATRGSYTTITSAPSPTIPPSSSQVELMSSYTGTYIATNQDTSNGVLAFSVDSQDQQGNITAT